MFVDRRPWSAQLSGDRFDAMAPVVKDAGTYSVSVLNYLAAAEQTNNTGLKYLTRALYAYSQAANAING